MYHYKIFSSNPSSREKFTSLKYRTCEPGLQSKPVKKMNRKNRANVKSKCSVTRMIMNSLIRRCLEQPAARLRVRGSRGNALVREACRVEIRRRQREPGVGAATKWCEIKGEREKNERERE